MTSRTSSSRKANLPAPQRTTMKSCSSATAAREAPLPRTAADSSGRTLSFLAIAGLDALRERGDLLDRGGQILGAARLLLGGGGSLGHGASRLLGGGRNLPR